MNCFWKQNRGRKERREERRNEKKEEKKAEGRENVERTILFHDSDYLQVRACDQLLGHDRLCDPMDCNPPDPSVHGDSPGNTRVGCHAFLPGIFPAQGSNPGLPHCRRFLYCLSHQGNPG